MHRLQNKSNKRGIVAEYGIGAGLLGEILLKDYNFTKYTGFDISDRQLRAARNRLEKCCNGRFELVLVDTHLDVKQLDGIEIFVSQAVIQHFLSREYTNRFFSTLNNASSINWMMLQVRETKYAQRSVLFATSTTRQDMELQLTNFRIEWQSEKKQNGYVFYVLERVILSKKC